MKKPLKTICEVCLLLDNNKELKITEHCNTCDADICIECKPDLWRRGLAAIKKKLI